MRTLMTIFLAMICISVGFVANAQAQSIIISVDGINQEADTLNFGARTENNPKVDSFFVVNNTNDTLLIPYDPKYLNRVNAIPFDNSFAEFELDTIQQRSRPFIILPGTRFPVKINFKVDTADKGAGFDADRFLKRGRIFINLCKYGDTTDIKASDTIHLIGDRTVRFMKPSDSVIVFDTMYIGTTKKDTLIVYNGTSSKTLDVNITTKNIANVKINPTDIGAKLIPPDSAYRIPIEYTVNSLSDSLISDVLTITSSPGAKSSEETSSIDLKTFVAFQKFEINKTITSNLITIGGVTYPSDTSLIYTDTIDVGKSRLFEIAIQNTGNIPITIDSITIEGPFQNNFKVDTKPSKTNVPPNESSQINIRFSPKLNGPINANIVVHTNLRANFPEITNNDERQIFNVTGIGKSGVLFISSTETCDTILYNEQKTCSTSCSITFNLENKSSTPVTIKSIDFNGDKSAFNFDPPLNSVIPIGSGETIPFKVDYLSGFKTGYFTGSLTFKTEGQNETVNFDYYSTTPESTIFRDTVIASPGDVLKIPLIVKTRFAKISQAAYFDFGFSISENSIRGFLLDSVTLNLQDSLKGKFRVTNVYANNKRTFSYDNIDPSLVNISDTIAFIHGKYYLNEFLQSEISIDNFFLGVGIDKFPCEVFKTVNLPKIIIKAKENSFCADQETLDSLFSDIRTLKVAFTAFMPMSGSVLEIQHFMPEPMHADISLYAVTGEKVETIFSGIAPKDVTKFQHPLSHLTKGVYYCEMKTGTFRKTIPIIISQ